MCEGNVSEFTIYWRYMTTLSDDCEGLGGVIYRQFDNTYFVIIGKHALVYIHFIGLNVN